MMFLSLSSETKCSVDHPPLPAISRMCEKSTSTENQTDRQTDRYNDRQTDRYNDRQTDERTDRQTVSQSVNRLITG